MFLLHIVWFNSEKQLVNGTSVETEDFIDGEVVATNDNITSVEIGLTIFDIDRYDVGFNMKIDVKDANGTMLGTNSLTMNEGNHDWDTTYIQVPVNFNSGTADEIFIEVTATSIPAPLYILPEFYQLSYYNGQNIESNASVSHFGGPTFIDSHGTTFASGNASLSVSVSPDGYNGYAAIEGQPLENDIYYLTDISKVEFTIPNMTASAATRGNTQAWVDVFGSDYVELFRARFSFDHVNRVFAAPNGTYTEADAINGYNLPLRYGWLENGLPNVEAICVYWDIISEVTIAGDKITFTLKEPYVGPAETWYRIECSN